MTRTRRRQTMRFMGFVALADTLFAVSAGLLLLNPISFASADRASDASASPTTEVQAIRQTLKEVVALERRLRRLEGQGLVIRQGTLDVLRNE